MSMLKTFLEIGCDKSLFEGLEISKETQLCEKYMGRFPVISISLKTVHEDNYKLAENELCTIIANEALRFPFLATSDKLTETDRKRYEQLTKVDETLKSAFAMSKATITSSLKTLSQLLEKYYRQKVIILIDEYDVPLAKANERNYYGEMINLIVFKGDRIGIANCIHTMDRKDAVKKIPIRRINPNIWTQNHRL